MLLLDLIASSEVVYKLSYTLIEFDFLNGH